MQLELRTLKFSSLRSSPQITKPQYHNLSLSFQEVYQRSFALICLELTERQVIKWMGAPYSRLKQISPRLQLSVGNENIQNTRRDGEFNRIGPQVLRP